MNNETLADIIAEMREQADEPTIESLGEVFPPVGTEDVKDWADRIEAAAKRDQAPGPSSGTKLGNASAMRAALEAIYMDAQFICDNRDEAMLVERRADHIERMVNAALSAPPRNCDRYADEDDAFAAWHESLNDGDVVSVRNAFKWLFATEGGAEC